MGNDKSYDTQRENYGFQKKKNSFTNNNNKTQMNENQHRYFSTNLNWEFVRALGGKNH